MPWKEPGKGDKDPWNSGGQQPPDLEEIFGNVSKRLQSLFGGGGKSSGSSDSGSSGSKGTGGVFSLVLLLIIFWVAWDAVHIIDEAEQGDQELGCHDGFRFVGQEEVGAPLFDVGLARHL